MCQHRIRDSLISTLVNRNTISKLTIKSSSPTGRHCSHEPTICHVVCQMLHEGAKHTCQMLGELEGRGSNAAHDGGEISL